MRERVQTAGWAVERIDERQTASQARRNALHTAPEPGTGFPQRPAAGGRSYGMKAADTVTGNATLGTGRGTGKKAARHLPRVPRCRHA